MEEFDESHYDVKPWHMLSNENYTEKNIRDARYDECKRCDKLFKPTRTCKECGCFMAMKTWLKEAECPIGKWGKV
jgi:hypothetical protein